MSGLRVFETAALSITGVTYGARLEDTSVEPPRRIAYLRGNAAGIAVTKTDGVLDGPTIALDRLARTAEAINAVVATEDTPEEQADGQATTIVVEGTNIRVESVAGSNPRSFKLFGQASNIVGSAESAAFNLDEFRLLAAALRAIAVDLGF